MADGSADGQALFTNQKQFTPRLTEGPGGYLDRLFWEA